MDGVHGASSLAPVPAVPWSPSPYRRTTSVLSAPARQFETHFVDGTAAGAVPVTRFTTWQRRGRQKTLGT